MQGLASAARRARVSEVLDLVGLAGFGARSVTSLSGGEAKRVALARSLAPAPPVLLLDEPLTGLDRELHDRLVVDLADLLRTTGTAALLVTHDPDEAVAVAHRVLTLHDLETGRLADGA
jgi:thiamine transport system ATP-binding protein